MNDPSEPFEDDSEDPLFEAWNLDIICSMEDPPAEAFETSWLRARELLEDAGPDAAILLLTVTTTRDDDLASHVVISSGYSQIPTNYILGILDTHLRALEGDMGEE